MARNQIGRSTLKNSKNEQKKVYARAKDVVNRESAFGVEMFFDNSRGGGLLSSNIVNIEIT